MFQPSVPVFDGNVCLGRRHDQRINMDSREDLLRVMNEAGIQKALVYHPYGLEFDTQLGNRLLLEAIGDDPNLIPQFVVNFPNESLPEFMDSAHKAGVRSLRAFPKAHLYPFTPWIAGEFLEWMSSEGIGLWLPMDHIEPEQVYRTVEQYPDLRVVLVGSHYSHFASLCPLVKALPNIYVDLSRFDVINGVEKLVNRIGPGRLLFGSNFPELAPAPYLYYLHHCNLSEADLRAICCDNLEHLLERR